MNIAEQIKQKREELGMSQEALAERLGVSRQAVSKWESGQSAPAGQNRAALVELLGLDIPGEAAAPKNKGLLIGGWAAAAVLLILSIVLLMAGEFGKTETVEPGEEEPRLVEVRFFDADMNTVPVQANWYDAANIEGVLVDYEGPVPNEVRMLITPTGTETIELTRLLAVKCPAYNESAVIIPADVLREEPRHDHICFELRYGDKVITSDIYNMFYDPDI